MTTLFQDPRGMSPEHDRLRVLTDKERGSRLLFRCQNLSLPLQVEVFELRTLLSGEAAPAAELGH